MAEVICPNCKTSFKVGNGENIVDTSKLSGTVELVPETIRNENKGENTMDLGTINFKGMTQEEKNEVLKAMGFNPFDFTNSVDKTDSVVQEIYENGYVKNEKLHRRWITAQTLRLLGWYYGVTKEKGWNGSVFTKDEWTNNVNAKYNWTYIFKMLANEYNSLVHLKSNSFREEIFNPNQLHIIFDDYIKCLREYFDSLRTKNCKGVPYKTIGGRNIFVSDFEKKVVTPMEIFFYDNIQMAINTNFIDYRRISVALKMFLERYFIKLPNSTPLSRTWVDMFKKAGAYYTMENLVKYSGLKLVNYETGELLNRDDSLKYLEECKSQQGYQLLALLKRSLEVNDFKFSEAI